ncbi:uncharacterized protein GGS22DRAFT_188099 [Annulohypoxylon maeteangense]|uniref:uncharacterized protein n=1 Tax=Annulohypoxylon maeteangense TaxID=1927788 RepID=UPI00200843C2|nr:uncharacterized protein GGS22DRAFT_188099 [Annulohypoxylon maeteangense]KAI0885812.1 hypothetical protein GGS22DRAFT_188099 [Annulohypoxylon maeteangense]
MLFLHLALLASLWWSTLGGAATLGSSTLLAPETPTLEKRLNCNGRGNFVVYESHDANGGYSMICLNGYVLATCSIYVAASGQVFTTLKDKVVGWVTGKKGDASDAGPQVKSLSTHAVTWSELYAQHATAGTDKYDISNGTDIDDGITALALHEDGFSASFSLARAGLITGRTDDASCSEQIHIHYWADRGHDSTVLSSSGIGSLVYNGLNDAYTKDRGQACYEMTNNGNWEGYLRVCFNKNKSQKGCYSCGGHNN